jgi:ribosome-associated protein
MRSADIDKILMELKIFDQESVAYRSQKITIEKWIKRLTLEGDKAIDDILIALPKIDRKHLRQLIRQAKKMVSEEKSKSANEKIFSYLIEFEFY